MATENKILIVEDDAAIAGVYQKKLAKEGFNIEIAENGLEAVESMKREVPALVLLDIIMPKMDGFGVLTEMQKSDALKAVPVIILSNLGQESDIKTGMDLGAKDYVVKADTPLAEIIEKIRGYIGA